MDLAFSPEDLAFRDEVRAFIAENFDDDLRALAQSKSAHVDRAGQIRWQKRALRKAGSRRAGRSNTAAPAGRRAAIIFDREMARAGVPATSHGPAHVAR